MSSSGRGPKLSLSRLVASGINVPIGLTLIPLAIYFKDGRAKLELGVARGKHQHDKRDTIKKKEQDRELRRMQMQRR